MWQNINLKTIIIMSIRESLISRNIFIVLTIIVGVFSPSNIIAQKNPLKFYELSSTVTLDSLHRVLMLHSFHNKDIIADTLALYSYGSEEVTLMVCPISKRVFSYWYRWEFNSSTDDEFVPKSKSSKKSHLEQSKQYYINICNYLKQKYGEPESIVYQKGMSEPIKYKDNQLDTLNYNHLFNQKSSVDVVWKNSERAIILKFDNWVFSKTLIIYKYLNYLNQAQKNDEYTLRQRQEGIWEVVKWAVLGLVVLLVIYIVYRITKKKQEEKEMMIAEYHKQIQIEENKKIAEQKRIKEQLQQSFNKQNNYVSTLVEKYGDYDKRIRLTPKESIDIAEIIVFSQSKHIIIDKKELLFSDILDCVVNDNIKERVTVQTIRGNSTATSKANTKNMIGRAVVGGVLLGGVGTIIGGSTAKRNTVIEYGTDTSTHNKEVEHNYTVAITIKDISNPVLYLNVGSNTGLKDEIVSLMKVIMSMK